MHLGGIDIHSRGIEALSGWIGSEACHLTTFCVRSSSMGDIGAQAIADALESNTSLKALSLIASNITATGAASLGRAFDDKRHVGEVKLGTQPNRSRWLGCLGKGRAEFQDIVFLECHVEQN
jgi:hypothetical protein